MGFSIEAKLIFGYEIVPRLSGGDDPPYDYSDVLNEQLHKVVSSLCHTHEQLLMSDPFAIHLMETSNCYDGRWDSLSFFVGVDLTHAPFRRQMEVFQKDHQDPIAKYVKEFKAQFGVDKDGDPIDENDEEDPENPITEYRRFFLEPLGELRLHAVPYVY